MEYRKRLKKEMWAGIALIIVGGVFIIADILNSDYVFMPVISSYCLGAGLGLLIKTLVCMKNKKFEQQHKVKDTDERNAMICKSAGMTTAIICFAITCIAGIVSDLLRMRDYARLFTTAVVIYIIVFCVSYIVYDKKM